MPYGSAVGNALDGKTALSDVAAQVLAIIAESAYAQATVNNNGAELILAGGMGRTFLTVVDYTAGATVITVNLSNQSAGITGTSGVAFAMGSSNNEAATNLAAWINNHATIGLYVVALAVGASVYCTKKVPGVAFTISSSVAGTISTTSPGLTFARLLGTGFFFGGSNPLTINPARMEYTGGHVYLRNASAANFLPFACYRGTFATATTPITPSLSNYCYTNEGATSQINFTLPSATVGHNYTFIVQDSDGIRITAAAGDTIRIGGSVSALAGYIESATIGDVITLQCINSTEWVAIATVGGAWTFGP